MPRPLFKWVHCTLFRLLRFNLDSPVTFPAVASRLFAAFSTPSFDGITALLPIPLWSHAFPECWIVPHACMNLALFRKTKPTLMTACNCWLACYQIVCVNLSNTRAYRNFSDSLGPWPVVQQPDHIRSLLIIGTCARPSSTSSKAA